VETNAAVKLKSQGPPPKAVVCDHFETFRVEASRVHERAGLPRFIDEEFRGFLRCGWLAGGFARFRCGSCGVDRLVPFSCKGRAVCPSCGGRRMTVSAPVIEVCRSPK